VQPTSSARSSTTTPLTKDRLSNGSSITPPSTTSDPGDEAGEIYDGNASPAVQIRALQADLSDKTHYIAALEKRLLHVRRSSQSRASLGLSPKASGEFVNEEGRWEQVVREKDEEIRELRERLDDKERMVVALRNAARKREAAEVSGRAESRMESRMGWRAESRVESRMAGGIGELKRGSGLSDLRRGNEGRGSIVETKRSSESVKRGSTVESLKRSSAAELRRGSGGG
jgi:centromeric protein E